MGDTHHVATCTRQRLIDIAQMISRAHLANRRAR